MHTLAHTRNIPKNGRELRAWHSCARARALTVWHRTLPAATFGLLIAQHPKWPLIEGHAKRFAPVIPLRPAPGGAA